MLKRLNTDDRLNVMIYRDGRVIVEEIPHLTFTQACLIVLFKKNVKNGDFDGMQPGRYHFKYTKVRRWIGLEAELIAVEE